METLLGAAAIDVADDMTEPNDRERLVLLESELRSLRDLLVEQRAADRQQTETNYRQLLGQLTTLATAADRFASAAGMEKLDGRLAVVEGLVQAFKAELVPRTELDYRLKNVSERQETMQGLMGQLSQNLVKLNDEWTAEEADQRLAEAKKDKRRNFVIALAAIVVTALVGIPAFISLFSGRDTKIVYEPAPVTTTTTIPAGGVGHNG